MKKIKKLVLSQIERYKKKLEELNNVLNILDKDHPFNKEMVLIRGGQFQTHTIIKLDDFYISRYELTMEEFDSFCTATGRALPDDEGWGRGKQPAINISWFDSIEFCNWLSKRDGLQPCYFIDSLHSDISDLNESDELKWTIKCDWKANGYRLPTEAEWEYAARGGRLSKGYAYAGDDHPAAVAWFEGNSNGQPHLVGTRKANELGLFDMSGNIFEWVWDRFQEEINLSGENPKNPKGPSYYRTIRGGCYHSSSEDCRITTRRCALPHYRRNCLGMRLARNA